MKIRILEVFVFCFALALTATAQTPVITSQPQSATNNIASAADFSVVATNAATYQWYFQGTNILTNQTSATLSLDDLSTNQAGSYTVVVTSANNMSVTSGPAVLTIVPGTIVQWTISTYPGGGSSNFLVQLFDHDKPATVQNFLHYITSGAYANMFIDRDSTNFVIQGGDYVATNRSNTNLAINRLVPGTDFPSQVDNEFGVGPLVHNTFGTLAMALVSGETNSATSAFFFNLVDNSAILDSQDFTVFGRILYGTNSGSNVLQYFNALSAPTNGIFDYLSGDLNIPTLPVNYDGTHTPTDANLFYCDFMFPTPPPVDTTPPTVAITFPASDAAFTNVGTLTVQGTAQDNVGLAEVFCVLTSSTGSTGGLAQTNAAVGTTNWSLNLGTIEPGVYQLTAYAQDGAGNLSAPVTEYFTNAANLPSGLAITNPAAGFIAQNTNAVLVISGTLPTSTTVTQITVQLFSPSNAVTGAMPAVINGASWSLTLSNLMDGFYTIVVVAQDSLGEEGLVSETFTAQFPPTIVSPPANLSILDGSLAEFSVGASNAVSYQWQSDGANIAGATNSTLYLTNVSTNLSGTSYQVILTNAFGAVTSAPVMLTVVTGTLVQITFSGFPDGSSSNVVIQLYDHEKPATVANFLRYITPAYYELGFLSYVPFTDMIWDICIPGHILQGGDYDAVDRTNEIAPTNLESTFYPVPYYFTTNSIYILHFASQVDNEYNVGPVIPNTFGTLAMAKQPGYPDSAANAFFFNLADNSTNLDNQNGGYTVFGRVISGSNVLQYFNTLSKPNQGIFDSTDVSTNTTLPDLPVNYTGRKLPADANLFFGAFTLLSTYNQDTIAPTVAVSFPTNGQIMTNADVVVQGTASDNVAVANVACFCRGTNFTNYVFAVGTTNWTADLGALPPGKYTNVVEAQDGTGNVSQTSIVFVVPSFFFVASTTGNGTLSPNLTSNNTSLGNTYSITAKPGSRSVFANWVSGTNSSINPTLAFIMKNGLQVTANFLSDNAGGSISIKYPEGGAGLTNSTFSINGKVSGGLDDAQITCQVFSVSTSYAVTTNMVVNVNNGNWSTPPLSLAPGTYIAQAIAPASGGRAALVNQEFSILTPLTVIVYGRGRAAITNGSYLAPGFQYTQGAEPAAGESFFSWNSGSGAFASSTFPFTMKEGLTFTLTFVSNSAPGKLTLASPAANAQTTNPTVILGGKIVSPLVATQIVCQLFETNGPVTAYLPATITGNNWTLAVSNLPMGLYKAVAMATDSSGGTALATGQFWINFYPRLAGSYNGLFFDPAVISTGTAGYLSFRLSAISPTVMGNYGLLSGSLMLPPKNYFFSVALKDTGAASITPTGFNGTLAMNFDVTNFSSEVAGSVTLGAAVSPLTAYRSLTKLSTKTVPSPGHYALSLMPETPTNVPLDGPPGDSFAAVTVSASGNLAVAGTLADDSTFSQSTGVSTNGVWPLYASFYKGRGILLGWETNLPSGECAGTLYWFKSASSGVYYTNGVDEQINSLGTNYVRPAAGVAYRIVFASGTFIAPVTNEFSFNAAGAMATTNQLKGSLVLSTGVLKGTVVNPSTGKTLDFIGVFVSPSQGGGGFILDAGAQTGQFEITPVSAP